MCENVSLQAILMELSIDLYKTYLLSADNTGTSMRALLNPTSVGIVHLFSFLNHKRNFDNTLTLKKVINSACMHNCACWLRSLQILWRAPCPQCFIAQSLALLLLYAAIHSWMRCKNRCREQTNKQTKTKKKSNYFLLKLKVSSQTGYWHLDCEM